MLLKFRRLFILLLVSLFVIVCILCRREGLPLVWPDPSKNRQQTTAKAALVLRQLNMSQRDGYLRKVTSSTTGNISNGSDEILDGTLNRNWDENNDAYHQIRGNIDKDRRDINGLNNNNNNAYRDNQNTPNNNHNENTNQRPDKPNFSKLQALLLFIGYPRSGSTLFGSLLDAHPHAVIANEYNLVGKWKNITRRNRSRDYIFTDLWKNSVEETISKQRAKNNNFFFSYFVPGLWQGKYRGHISVIGDKRCVSTTRGLSVNSTRFTDLSRRLAIPIKFIHIVRNPFDTIATMTIRASAKRLRMQADRSSSLRLDAPQLLSQQTQIYLRLVDMNVKLRKRFGKSVLDVDYSKFIRHPKKCWKRICDFLDLHCSSHYINSITKLVFKKETFTRRHIVWTDPVKNDILRKIASVSFLRGMRFDIPRDVL